MSRRAVRRRRDIQRELLLGPATVQDLAHALRRPRFVIWSDLDLLETAGAVTTVWVQRPGWPAGALAAAYRLLTIAEQDAHSAKHAAFEQHLRAALHAVAQHAYPSPGDPS